MLKEANATAALPSGKKDALSYKPNLKAMASGSENEEEYEALALTLATDPKLLGQVKSKLDGNRLTQPLFDSEMYTRHLEAGYHMAYDQYFNEQERSDIVVPK